MTRVICSLGVVLMLAGTAHGAFLYLENAADGSASMALAPGESGEMNIVLFLHGVDLAEEITVNLVLSVDDEALADSIPITDILAGDCGEWEGKFPANIGEFGFVQHCDPVEPPTTLVLATLVITHTGTETAGSVQITLDEAAHAPAIWSEDCSFPWGLGFAGILPCFADPVVGGQNDPFVINLVPPSEECEGDANGDGTVDPLDSGFVLARFGCEVDAGDPSCDTADQNDDGAVDPLDVGLVLARFGECP